MNKYTGQSVTVVQPFPNLFPTKFPYSGFWTSPQIGFVLHWTDMDKIFILEYQRVTDCLFL